MDVGISGLPALVLILGISSITILLIAILIVLIKVFTSLKEEKTK